MILRAIASNDDEEEEDEDDDLCNDKNEEGVWIGGREVICNEYHWLSGLDLRGILYFTAS